MSLGRHNLLQQVYQQIRDAAIEWHDNGEPFNESSKFGRTPENSRFPELSNISYFWVQLNRKSNVKSSIFLESANRFIEYLEQQGLLNSLLPISVSVEKTNNHCFIEGEIEVIKEGREDAIAAYRQAVIDAIRDDKSGDLKYYGRTDTPPDQLEISVFYNSGPHRKRIIKNLNTLVKTICGPLDPIQASVSDQKQKSVMAFTNALITFSIPQLTEAGDALIQRMALEIISGFHYAEETYFQDQGKKSPYALRFKNGTGVCEISMLFEPTLYMTLDRDQCRHRLLTYVNEYFDDMIIKPRISDRRSIGSYTISLSLDNLKEEVSADAFAIQVAHALVPQFEAELKRKGAVNCATFTVRPRGPGGAWITANLANKSVLTSNIVERAMLNVVDAELPADNLLKLEAGLAMIGDGRITMSISPC